MSVGVIALDGTKLHANASDRANREYWRIAEEILAEADQVDAEEDARFGGRRGDELPAELSNSNDRRQRLRDARHALEAERAGRQRPVPGDRQGRLLMARDRLEEDHALESRVFSEHNAWRATDSSPRKNRAPAQLEAPAAPTGQANTTDPDSRKVKATRGYLQGYNVQAVTTEQQIVIAAELTIETDVAQLAPMIGHARRELANAGIDEQPGTVLADAGYWNAGHIEKLTVDGSQVLVPPRRLEGRQTEAGTDRRALQDDARSAQHRHRRMQRLMREHALLQPKRSEGRPKRPGYFEISRPDELWHLDMTSIWVAEHGWVYLNAAIDCCTREITGWAIDVRCRATEATAVIDRAVTDG